MAYQYFVDAQGLIIKAVFVSGNISFIIKIFVRGNVK